MSLKGDMIKWTIYYILEMVKEILFKDDGREPVNPDHTESHEDKDRNKGGR